MHFMFNTETGFQDKEHTCSADRNLGAMLLSINSQVIKICLEGLRFISLKIRLLLTAKLV